MVTAAAWMTEGAALNAVRVVGGVDEHSGKWARCEPWAV
jgi:hypothetical protein